MKTMTSWNHRGCLFVEAMMIVRKLFMPILILIPTLGIAQNDLEGKTSRWKISSHTDLDGGEVMNKKSVLVLNDNFVFWGLDESNGINMDVTSVDGRWDSRRKSGKVTYNVDVAGDTGTITVQGNGRKARITIRFIYSDGASNIRLIVKSVSYE